MNELEIVGFVDESCKPVRSRATGKPADKGRHYVVVAAIMLHGDIDNVRTAVTDLSARLEAPLHYYDLTKRQRQDALTQLADIDGWEAAVFETARPFGHGTNEHHARAKVLETAMVELNRMGTTTIVLESRGHHRDGFARLNQKDHDVLRRLQRHNKVAGSLRIRHETKQEPLLAIADLVAGARTDQLCAVADEPHALISHRVTTTERIALA